MVTVADASLLDYETATSHTITVQAASTDGSTETKSFTIALADDTSEFTVSAVSDTNAAADGISEGASNGDVVGVTAFASDGDATDTVTYSLTDDAGGRFAIDATTGVVTVADASLLDYETATSHTITVQAESSDGSTGTKSFTIALSDDTGEFSVSALSDTDAASDGVSESASNGDTVGVTAFASDADASDTVTYSLTDDAGGRFTIDATTGVVTVADASLLDYETATSHTITVQAESSDGSTETKSFTIALSDDTSEFSVAPVADTDAAADTVSEGASNGDTVGITAFASDADATDTVTYSLADDAGGRFTIDATTGVVTVADASLLDYETATSHTITVQADVYRRLDRDEILHHRGCPTTRANFPSPRFPTPMQPPNTVSEDASERRCRRHHGLRERRGRDRYGHLQPDRRCRRALRHRCDDRSGHGGRRLAARLRDGGEPHDHGAGESRDGSTTTQNFTIDVTDVNEAPTGGSVQGPSPAPGAALHLDATDIDADGGTADNPGNGSAVSRWDDASGGNHDAVQQSSAPVVAAGAINGKDAIDFSGANDALHVSDTSAINLDTYEERSHAIAFQTGDDISGFQVIYEEGANIRGYSLSIAPDPANGGQPTLWAFVYNNAEWGSGDQYKAINLGPVAANETYNVIMVHDASAADLSDRTFSAYVNGDYMGTVTEVDVQYPHSGDIGIGGYLDTTINPVTNEVLSGNGGEFAGKVGEVLIWNSALDTQQISETSSYLNEKWGGAPSVGEDAPNGTAVFAVADIVDPDGSDTYTYSLADDAGGRFAIDASTGVVTVADASLIDYDAAQSHAVTVRVTDAGGNTLEIPVTIEVGDGNDVLGALSDADAATDTVSEGASNGDVVGITAFASDADIGDTVTYSLTDDAGGRFAIDATTGVVTVADASQLDYETATSHTITVQAESSDGSTETKSFTVALSDDTGEFAVSAVSDTDAASDGVSEGASNGDTVGVTAFASDGDASDTVTYSLTDDAGGRFAIDASTGVVTVADASLLDYETATSHTITVQAASADGSTQTQDFTIALSDDTSEFSVSAVTDADTAANTISEHASNGDTVGITGFASDADASDTITYSLTDDAGGRFTIDATTGVVTVADASLLDHDTADSHTVTVLAASSDGSTQTQDFAIAVTTDYNELHGPGFVVGTEGDDRITGTSNSESHGGEEIMLGLGGDDVLIGNGNEDRLIGGAGDDTLSGGDQSDVLVGGTGDDTVDGGSGNDVFVFRMGDGHDTVSGGSGDDTIMLVGADGGSPDPSDWSLNLTSGSASWSMDNVSLSADAAGTITFTDGSSMTFDGVETIDFSGSYDIDGDGSHGGGPHGGGSHGTGQVLIADAGGDSVSGGSGEDTIFGGSGADTLSGGDNEDLLMGGEGGDALYGGNDNDVLYGDGGSDALYGDKGDDVLVGGDGGDALYGGQGNDVLYGDAGNDALYGEDGNDTLYGGAGDDAAYGGKGDDTYIFGAGMGTDSFAGGGGPWTDTIQLSGVDGVTAYNGWTLADATVVDSGDGYIELAADSDGTITMDDGSELTFTDVDRIEW